MTMLEMADWPGTPGRERLALAVQLIAESLKHEEEMADWLGSPGLGPLASAVQLLNESLKHEEDNPQYPPEPGELNTLRQDARMLLDYRDTIRFSMVTHSELAEMAEAGRIQEGMDMVPVVARGSDEQFIGMLIDLGEPEGDDPEYGESGIMATRLYRDAGWVGLNEQLPLCRGLEIHIFSWKGRPEEPGVILAIRQGRMDGPPAVPEPPGELNGVIREVMRWHGATSCAWHDPEGLEE